jgi:neutral ceramidase
LSVRTIIFLLLGPILGLPGLPGPPASAAEPVSLSAAGEPPLRVGFAQADITPPPGYRMYGSLFETFARGTHDPLLVKALVIEQGSTRAGIALCDLCFVSRNLTEPARARAAALAGIPVGNLVILATHTHGGPEYDGVQRDLRHRRAVQEQGTDPHEPVDLLARYVTAVSDTLAAAAAGTRPARLELVRSRQDGLAFNRRYHLSDGSVVFNPGKKNPRIVAPAGPVDTDLPCLLFREAAGGVPLGSFAVFAMHVATFSSNHTWGADYPGVLAGRLERHFGSSATSPRAPAFVSLFAQGTAGDINHIDVASDAPQPGETEPVRIGNALADTLVAALPEARPLAEPRLRMRSATVQAPLVEITAEQVARSREMLERTDRPGGIAFLVTVEAWRVLNTERLRSRFGDRLPLEVNALVFDRDTALVCLPHEVFVRIGLAIKDRSPFRHTLVASMAHDLDFYVLDRQGYAEGGYEAVTSSLKPGAGELLIATALELLRGLHGDLHGVAAPGRSYE